MNNHNAPHHRAAAHSSPGLDPRAIAGSRRDAMRRRAHQIRKSVVMLTIALFLAAFLAVYVQLASGHDPALTANAKARRNTARLLARAASSKAAEQAAARKAAAAAASKRKAEVAAAEQSESSVEASNEASTTTSSAPSASATTSSETTGTGSEAKSSEPVSPVTTSQS